MKKLQILGASCHKCNQLIQATRQAADELGIEYTLERVDDINRIMEFNVMMMPALVVDGKVKVVGKVPSHEEIKRLILSSH